MFYYIEGTLVLTEPNAAILDNNGIAYRLAISANTLSSIAPQKGNKIRLYTYLVVKEDALELIGFKDVEELAAFKMLITVSGIGAKSALSVLSFMSPEKFALAVITGDTKAISKAQGIGAKTAARVVLELKDKISKELSADGGDVIDFGAPSSNNKLSDAQNVLLVWGYSRAEVANVLRGIDITNMEVEDIIKAALKKFGG
ncbi:MAG: Holliday junction branch migration protein RuvA [Oscillospiraceae bacterium]|nr:Holliday junction branch migration protein RuvA [Oscillospiraceae bacterium]